MADGPSLLGEAGLSVEDTRRRSLCPGVRGRGSRCRRESDRWAERERGAVAAWREARRLSGASFESKAELRPCAGLTFGEVRGQATSLTNSPTVTEPWLSAEATLAVRWFLTSQLLAEVEGGAVFPIERPTYAFVFQPDNQPLYAVPRVTERIAAGVGFRF